MEGKKRKREDNGEMNGKIIRKGDDVNAEEQTQLVVTEDEVEEFYAILRRIHVAVKYFEKGNNKEGRRNLTDTGWRPLFEAEDFNEHNGVNNNGAQKEDDLGFDLNLDPASS